MKKFSSCLREHATKILNFKKKKMLPLTREGLKLHHGPTTQQTFVLMKTS